MLVLGTWHREIDEVLATELRINQGLIGVEEPRDVTEAGFVARTWIAGQPNGCKPVPFPSPSAGCPATSLEEEVDGKT